MIIFSFDCAIKNFGYCVMKLSTQHWRVKLYELVADVHIKTQKLNRCCAENLSITDVLKELLLSLKSMESFFTELIVIKDIGVRDIRDVSTEKLSASNTKIFLTELDTKFGKPDYVLVERQMSLNNHAYAVENFVEYHYANQARVVTMPPSLKNMICFDQKDGKYECFIAKHNNYTANKKHSTYNCKYFFEKNGLWQYFKFDSFKKFDDLSDAFMMGMAWILLKC